ncbi:hypothetical protein K0M31_017330 [Melipona bicolor]|uniref:REKLES domain-containing protein n=1 Tax=Melipona bicolor TaxID=60889 RepID=A0AA40G4W8_9HYME|nr:hypothetical protein K0M31_017330 [Melipona bicolor]
MVHFFFVRCVPHARDMRRFFRSSRAEEEEEEEEEEVEKAEEEKTTGAEGLVFGRSLADNRKSRTNPARITGRGSPARICLSTSDERVRVLLSRPYMKYLYPYECEKRRLSTPAELQAAIDGNRREGRRSSYGTYTTNSAAASNESLVVQRNPHAASSLALHTQMSPLSLVTAVTASGQHHGPQSLVNGSAVHAPSSHHLHHSQHLQGVPATASSAGPPVPGMAPTEFEARMVEYVKLLNKELRNAGNTTPPPMVHRQDTISPPTPSTPPRDVAFSALDVSRLTLWNMYSNNGLYPGIGHQSVVSPQPSPQPPQVPTPEPQREALDLGLRSPPISSPLRQSSPCLASNLPMKRDQDFSITIGPTPAKRLLNEDNFNEKIIGTNIKISNRASKTAEYKIATVEKHNTQMISFFGTSGSRQTCTNILQRDRKRLPNVRQGICDKYGIWFCPGDGRNGDNSLVVSVELNGIIYQGVLFAQTDTKAGNNAATCSSSNSKSSRSIVS